MVILRLFSKSGSSSQLGRLGEAALAAFLACGIPAAAAAQAQTAPEPSVVVSGLNLPSALASDSQGNLYVVDEGCAIPGNPGDCNLYKETPSGATYAQSRVAAFTSADRPTSIAVDGSGNVYVGAQGKGVLKETPSGQTWTQSAVGCAFPKPAALAFDGKDSFFVFDSESGHVYREKATDTCATATVVASAGNVTGLAVDSCGALYLAESSGAASIIKETPVMGGYAQSSVGSGMAGLIGVGVDAHGDVYTADVIGRVTVWVPNGQEYTQHTVMKGLALSPLGPMAFDGASNFYYVDLPNNRIWKVAPSFPLPAMPSCGATPAPAPAHQP